MEIYNFPEDLLLAQTSDSQGLGGLKPLSAETGKLLGTPTNYQSSA